MRVATDGDSTGLPLGALAFDDVIAALAPRTAPITPAACAELLVGATARHRTLVPLLAITGTLLETNVALVTGLYRMAEPAPVVKAVRRSPRFAALRVDFTTELTFALTALLTGLVASRRASSTMRQPELP